MRTLKKVCNLTVVAMSIVLVFSGCNLFNSGSGGYEPPESNGTITYDKSVDLKELDLLILNSIYPSGLKDSLDDAVVLAQSGNSRNAFNPSNYNDVLGWDVSNDAPAGYDWILDTEGWTISQTQTRNGFPILINGAGEKIHTWDHGNGRYSYTYTNGVDVYEDVNGYKVYFYENNGSIFWEDRDGNAIDKLGSDYVDVNGNTILENSFQETTSNADLSALFVIYEKTRDVTPKLAYEKWGSGDGEKRFPASGYLDRDLYDPAVAGEYFTLTKHDAKRYKVVFTIEFLPGLSSLEKVVTTYYVDEDSWTAYNQHDKHNRRKGWSSEIITYRNGKIGTKSLEYSFSKSDDNAKYLFFAPDYDPFTTVTSGEFDFFDGTNFANAAPDNVASGSVRNEWTISAMASYSSISKTTVKGPHPISTQYGFYTELDGLNTGTSYPSYVGATGYTGSGDVRSGLTYFKRAEDSMTIVTASNRYFNTSGKFLCEDVKSFEHYPDDDEFIYHHKYFNVDTYNTLNYINQFDYFNEASVEDVRTATPVKQVITDISHIEETTTNGITTPAHWEGFLSLSSSLVSPVPADYTVDIEVTLNDSQTYMVYTAVVNKGLSDQSEIVFNPNTNNGEIDRVLTGGVFKGTVEANGSIRGIYWPYDFDINGYKQYYNDNTPIFEDSIHL